jgi:hypothetical protein
MNWNTRYANDKELSIDADFNPDERIKSFKRIKTIADLEKTMRANPELAKKLRSAPELAKKMRANPECYWCGEKLTYDEVAVGSSVCSDECYEMMHR